LANPFDEFCFWHYYICVFWALSKASRNGP
jgi:hypothetical protein